MHSVCRVCGIQFAKSGVLIQTAVELDLWLGGEWIGRGRGDKLGKGNQAHALKTRGIVNIF